MSQDDLPVMKPTPVIYATCTRCHHRTRLTPRLALELAAKPGPPTSVCCSEPVRVEEALEGVE